MFSSALAGCSHNIRAIHHFSLCRLCAFYQVTRVKYHCRDKSSGFRNVLSKKKNVCQQSDERSGALFQLNKLSNRLNWILDAKIRLPVCRWCFARRGGVICQISILVGQKTSKIFSVKSSTGRLKSPDVGATLARDAGAGAVLDLQPRISSYLRVCSPMFLHWLPFPRLGLPKHSFYRLVEAVRLTVIWYWLPFSFYFCFFFQKMIKT